MANSTSTNPIHLDTFTSAISLATTLGYKPFNVIYIEWQEPTTVGHTAVVTLDGTVPVFDETCIVANQSIIKYFYGAPLDDIRIASSGVQSGKISIMLA